MSKRFKSLSHTIRDIVEGGSTVQVKKSKLIPPNENDNNDPKEYSNSDMALDAATFVPGPAGQVASGVAAARDFSRGDYVSGGVNALMAIPLAHEAGTGVKLGAMGLRAAEKFARPGIEAASKLVGDTASKVVGSGIDAVSNLGTTVSKLSPGTMKSIRRVGMVGKLSGVGSSDSDSGTSSSPTMSPIDSVEPNHNRDLLASTNNTNPAMIKKRMGKMGSMLKSSGTPIPKAPSPKIYEETGVPEGTKIRREVEAVPRPDPKNKKSAYRMRMIKDRIIETIEETLIASLKKTEKQKKKIEPTEIVISPQLKTLNNKNS